MGYLNGIQVTNFITTTAGSDTYATHLDILGKGGLHSGLSGITSLYVITQERRTFGMFATVTSDPNPANVGTYQLSNIALGGATNVLTDNNNWIKFTSGGGGTVVPILFADHFIFTGNTIFTTSRSILQIVAVEQDGLDLEQNLQFNVFPNSVQVLTATTSVQLTDRFVIKYFGLTLTGNTSGITGGYTIVDPNGILFPNRTYLQFSGATVQVFDDLPNNKTIINIVANTGNTSSLNYVGNNGIAVVGNVISYTGITGTSVNTSYTSGLGINAINFANNNISVDLSNYQFPNQILLSGQTSSINLNASGITIDSSDSLFKGITESRDLSPNYNDLSHINRGYFQSKLDNKPRIVTANLAQIGSVNYVGITPTLVSTYLSGLNLNIANNEILNLEINPNTTTLNGFTFCTSSSLDSVNNILYINNFPNGIVSKVNVSNNSLIGTITGLGNPASVIYNNSKLYVVDKLNGNLYTIDTTTNAIINTVSGLTSPVSGALDVTNNKFYVINYINTSSTISVINLLTNTITNTIPLIDSPSDIRIDNLSNKIFVTVNTVAFKGVAIYNLTTYALITNLNTYATYIVDAYKLALDSINNKLYVGGLNSSTIIIINTITNSIFGVINGFFNPGNMDIDYSNKRLFIANTGDNKLKTVDLLTNTVINSINTNIGLGFVNYDSNSEKLYFGSYSTGQLTTLYQGSPQRQVWTLKGRMSGTTSGLTSSQVYKLVDETYLVDINSKLDKSYLTILQNSLTLTNTSDQQVLFNNNGIVTGTTSLTYDANNKRLNFGNNNTISGNTSKPSGTFGDGNVAGNKYSFVFGFNSKALGQYSYAEGYLVQANGNYSHAEGYQTTASGNFGSHAEGSNTIASGQYSHAEGNSTTASGYASHTEGELTIANGQTSHAEGFNTKSGGYTSHAEGDTTKANGQSSHAEGYQTTASGDYSHAEGYQTTASDLISHAEGSNTTASGQGSHAEGYFSIASGPGSHVEGYGSIASGRYSHAEGQYTRAYGDFSHAGGKYSNAYGLNSFVYTYTNDGLNQNYAYADRSAILGGGVGGFSSIIPSGNTGSVLLGNSNFVVPTGFTYTTFVKNLYALNFDKPIIIRNSGGTESYISVDNNNQLNFNGNPIGVSQNYQILISNYTTLATDQYLECSGTTSLVLLCTGIPTGKSYEIFNNGSGSVTTITSSTGALLNGLPNKVLNVQNQTTKAVWNGTEIKLYY